MVDIVVLLSLKLLFIFHYIQEILRQNSHFYTSYINGTLLPMLSRLGPFALLRIGSLH